MFSSSRKRPARSTVPELTSIRLESVGSGFVGSEPSASASAHAADLRAQSLFPQRQPQLLQPQPVQPLVPFQAGKIFSMDSDAYREAVKLWSTDGKYSGAFRPLSAASTDFTRIVRTPTEKEKPYTKKMGERNLLAYLSTAGMLRCHVTGQLMLDPYTVQIAHVLLPHSSLSPVNAGILPLYELLLGCSPKMLSVNSRMFLMPLTSSFRNRLDDHWAVILPSYKALQAVGKYIQRVDRIRSEELSPTSNEERDGKNDLWIAVLDGHVPFAGREFDPLRRGRINTFFSLHHPQSMMSASSSCFPSHLSPIAAVINAIRTIFVWQVKGLHDAALDGSIPSTTTTGDTMFSHALHLLPESVTIEGVRNGMYLTELQLLCLHIRRLGVNLMPWQALYGPKLAHSAAASLASSGGEGMLVGPQWGVGGFEWLVDLRLESWQNNNGEGLEGDSGGDPEGDSGGDPEGDSGGHPGGDSGGHPGMARGKKDEIIGKYWKCWRRGDFSV